MNILRIYEYRPGPFYSVEYAARGRPTRRRDNFSFRNNCSTIICISHAVTIL